jgi:hypothetical protein
MGSDTRGNAAAGTVLSTIVVVTQKDLTPLAGCSRHVVYVGLMTGSDRQLSAQGCCVDVLYFVKVHHTDTHPPSLKDRNAIQAKHDKQI